MIIQSKKVWLADQFVPAALELEQGRITGIFERVAISQNPDLYSAAVTQRKIARNEINERIFSLAAAPITKQTNFVVLVCTSEIRPTKPKLGASASCRWVNERTDIFCDEFSKAAFPNYWLLIPLQSEGGRFVTPPESR